jgi:hypothetical protein
MVLSLIIPLRRWYHLESLITERHLNNAAKVMLATGLVVAYGYLMEAFMSWYSSNTFEQFMMKNRAMGPYGYMYWILILCNILIPQSLWSKKVRLNVAALFMLSIVINIGMWLERYVIIVTSLYRDFLPSSWAAYSATKFDFSMFFGTIGFFLSLIFLFVRFLPAIAISEIRAILPGAKPKPHGT